MYIQYNIDMYKVIYLPERIHKLDILGGKNTSKLRKIKLFDCYKSDKTLEHDLVFR